MIRLAFTGRFCTGKDTRAHVLRELIPDTLQLSFGAAVKAAVAQELGIDALEVEQRKSDLRDHLQRVGNEGHDEGRWVKIMDGILEEIDHYENTVGPYAKALVVTDVRYQDEVELLRYYGFTVIRLNAPRAELQQRYIEKFGKPFTDEQWNHISEAGIDMLDVDREWNAMENPRTQLRSYLTADSLLKLKNTLKGFFGGKEKAID